MTNEEFKTLCIILSEEDLKANRYTVHYRKEVQRGQKLFFDWTKTRQDISVQNISKKELVEYHNWLSKQKSKTSGTALSAHTINSLYHCVIMLYTTLYQNDVIKENPTHGLNLTIKESREIKRRPLSKVEIEKLLESIEPDSELTLRDRTIYELIYSSGLRVSETARLKIKDVDLERREIRVRGKLDRDRIVPISEVAKEFLRAHIGEREGGENSVFLGFRGASYRKELRGQQISRRFRELLRRTDMDYKDISTHSIRHSTATHLLENGASIRQVQELLGHSDIENTVRYTQVQVDGTAKVYRKYHPGEHELFEVMDEEYVKKVEEL